MSQAQSRLQSFILTFAQSITLISILIIPHLGFSQGTEDKFKVNIIPPSPEAAALAKYADIPVSLYSGIPEISIPLFEVKERTLSLPINLSYHASGNKIETIAPRTGLGWTVSAQGSISRTVRGFPDEQPVRGFLKQAPEREFYKYLVDVPGEERWVWLHDLADGCVDLEPDLFYFNFGPYSGTFTFNHDGSIAMDASSSIKIIRSPVGLTSWQAIGEDGTIYTFDVIETTEVQEQGPPNLTCNLLVDKSAPQAWYLSKIESANKESWIKFEYENYTGRNYTLSSESKNHNIQLAPADLNRSFLKTVTHGKNLRKITTSSGQTTIDFLPGEARTDYDMPLPSDNGAPLLVGYTLGEMIVKNNRGTIIKDWRFGYDYSTGRLTLKTVTEWGGNLSKPPYTFSYHGSIGSRALYYYKQDHWGFVNDNTVQSLIPEEWKIPGGGGNPVYLSGANREPSLSGALQGILTRITYPTGGKDSLEFELHDYSYQNGEEMRERILTPVEHSAAAPLWETPFNQWYQRDIDFTIPDGITHFSIVVDFTYALGQIVGHLYQPSVVLKNLNTGVELYSRTGNGFAGGTDSDPIPTFDHLDERISNPSAGQYRLTIKGRQRKPPISNEPTFTNSIAVGLNYDAPTNQFHTLIKQGGGIRIAKIRRSFGNGNPDQVTFYKYRETINDTVKSTGSLTEARYIYSTPTAYYHELVGGNPTSPLYELRQGYSRFSQNRAALGATKGSHVGYKTVETWHGENAAHGKTIHHFTSAIESRDLPSLEVPFAPSANYDYKRGLLKNQLEFDNSGRLVKEMKNTYFFREQKVKALKVGWAITGGPSGPGFVHKYALGFYDVVLGYNRLTQTTETNYFPDQLNMSPVVLKKKFMYNEDGNKQLGQTVMYDSDGDSTYTQMIYPSDQNAIATPTVLEMRQRNMQNQLLESFSWKYNTAGQKMLLSGISTNFISNNNKIVPSSIQSVKINTPQVATDPLILARTLSETRLNYTGYNYSYVNLLEHSLKDGMRSAYIWGESGTVVIAKVDHAQAKQIHHTSFEEETTGFSAVSSKTGRYSKTINGVYTVPTANRPTFTGNYIISWWEKIGSNPWVYKEKLIQNYSIGAVINTDAVNGLIDEVRLYPEDAKMTTFTHEPLVGVTSITDANNVTIYFEYDEFNRLKCKRDQDSNIIEWYDYQFQQTPESAVH